VAPPATVRDDRVAIGVLAALVEVGIPGVVGAAEAVDLVGDGARAQGEEAAAGEEEEAGARGHHAGDA
jgi:hypothetical protein